VRLPVQRVDPLGCRDGGVQDAKACSPHATARIDLPFIQYIEGIVRLANIDTLRARQEVQAAKRVILRCNPDSLSFSRDVATSHHTLSHGTAATRDTPVFASSRDRRPEFVEAQADGANPKLDNGSASTDLRLSPTITGQIQSSGSDAYQGSSRKSDEPTPHTEAHGDLARRYVELPIGELPHHVAYGEIQHIRELLDRPRGKYWLQESSDLLRCPHCPWTLDRARCRPFSNLGAPRKYGDADEAKAGRAKVRKVARQKKLESRRNEFWAAIRDDVGQDEYYMTQSAWWREIDRLKRQRDDLQSKASSAVDQEESHGHRVTLDTVIKRIKWCEDRVVELKKIVHT